MVYRLSNGLRLWVPPQSLFSFVASSDTKTRGPLNLPVDDSTDPFDPSGRRVSAYIDLVDTAHRILELKRCFTSAPSKENGSFYGKQPEAFASSEKQKKVWSKLSSLNKRADGKRFLTTCKQTNVDLNFCSLPCSDCILDSSIFYCAKHLQRKLVTTWRGEPDPVRSLVLPVSVQDETTKKGASVLMVDYMVRARLIYWNSGKGRYDLTPDYHKKSLLLVGDGLYPSKG